MKLLVIDGDYDLVEMLTGWLKMRGYEVFRAYNIEQAASLWLGQRPDLILVDPASAQVDLLAFCQELCQQHDALLLAMSESKEVVDEIRCLESGADDYLQKPFFPSQLLAHIHAVSRRGRSTLRQSSPSTVTVGAVHVDLLRCEAMVRGKRVRLTPMESKLLYLLAINAGDVCTSEQIITYVWGYTGDGDRSLIKAHIRKLRKKIEVDASHPHMLKTVAGVGYSLVRSSGEEQRAIHESQHLSALPHELSPNRSTVRQQSC